jgi:hypothetical protein
MFKVGHFYESTERDDAFRLITKVRKSGLIDSLFFYGDLNRPGLPCDKVDMRLALTPNQWIEWDSKKAWPAFTGNGIQLI